MDQPVPNVTAADVERIVRRDFPVGQYEQVLAVLRRYGTQPWEGGSDRVRLAILKLADGDIGRLERATDIAKIDFRDILLAAEYPLAAQSMSRPRSDAERQEIYAQDWAQYEAWLKREGRPPEAG